MCGQEEQGEVLYCGLFVCVFFYKDFLLGNWNQYLILYQYKFQMDWKFKCKNETIKIHSGCQKLSEGYTVCLCTNFAIPCESEIQNKKLKKIFGKNSDNYFIILKWFKN